MRKKVLYFYHVKSSFVVKDLDILLKEYDIVESDFKIKGKFSVLLLLIKQFTFLFKYIFKADIIVCQFAGYHSILPTLFGRVFRRPILIIPGGIDCVKFNSINYGNFTKPFLGKLTEWSYKLATHIAPVHQALIYSEYKYTNLDGPAQGYKAHCKEITPATVIHNGYDSNVFLDLGLERKSNSFITIASGLDSEIRRKIKGIDLLLQVAKTFPEYTFTILGASNFNSGLKNIVVLPPVENKDLVKILNEYEFYLQLSLSEGFPNALCEAMLCGCIPIGSAVASIPEIIGKAGFILESKDENLLNDLIKKAINSNKEFHRKAAREKVKNDYSIDRREKELLKLLSELDVRKD